MMEINADTEWIEVDVAVRKVGSRNFENLKDTSKCVHKL